MDSQRQKIVSLGFVVTAGIVAYIIFSVMLQVVSIYDVEARVKNIDLIVQGSSLLVGAIVFLILQKNDRINQYMHEVVAELSRVTWPTSVDTYRATIVVIIMVLVSGVVLGGLDSLWSWLLNMII